MENGIQISFTRANGACVYEIMDRYGNSIGAPRSNTDAESPLAPRRGSVIIPYTESSNLFLPKKNRMLDGYNPPRGAVVLSIFIRELFRTGVLGCHGMPRAVTSMEMSRCLADHRLVRKMPA